MRFAGIALSIPGNTPVPAPAIPSPADLLQQSDMFGGIEQTQRNFLASHLDRGAIAAAIKLQPDLAHGLEALVQRGQAPLRRDAAAHDEEKRIKPEMFLSGLRNFIHVLQSRV